MLNKKRTAKWARLRLLLVLPMAIGMLCVSTLAFTKDYGYVDLLPEKASVQKPVEEVNDEITMAKKGRYSPSYVFDENNQYKSLEKRLIVINGNLISDNNKYYGNSNADNIVFLKPKNSIEKYGVKGKYGAVEIYGKEPKLTFQPEYVIADTAKFPAPIPQKDQVKFPPPVVKPDSKDKFYTRYGRDKATGKIVLREKRYIEINGSPIKDMATFYGVYNAESVKYYTKNDAINKYGVKGEHGAVEITGKDIKYFAQITLPPPPPSQDQKFPPPIIRKDKTSFYPMRNVDKKGNVNSLDSRIIVINGKKIENIETFFGVTNASNAIDIDAATAIKKYGKGAKYGAIEITGNNLKYVKSLADGPPPPVMEQTKFPPPVIKKGSKTKSDNDKTSSAIKSKIAEDVKRNQEVISKIAQRNDNVSQQQFLQNQVKEAKAKVNQEIKNTKAKSDAIYGKDANKIILASMDSKPVYVKSDDVNAYPTRINISDVLDRSNGKKLIVPSKSSEEKSISIFDRFGNELFRDTNYSNDWAGFEGNLNEHNGKILNLGTYYYVIAIKAANGKANIAKGYLPII